jgi:vitamin B12 transporter
VNIFRNTILLAVAGACAGATPISDTQDDGDSLGTVVVTAPSGLSEPLRDTTANVTVIDKEEIEERGYRSLAELLDGVSGFQSYSSGGPGQLSGVTLRGFGGGNILITMNGIPLKDPSDPSFSTSLSHILLDGVERVEIVKGAQGGVWGADASAGVINIVTGGADSSGVGISLGYGSYDTGSASLSLSSIGDVGSFRFGATHFKSGSFSALSPRDAEDDEYTNDTVDMEATLNISESSSIGILYHGIDGDFDYDGYSMTGMPMPDDDVSEGSFSERLTALRYDYGSGAVKLHASISRNGIERRMNDVTWGASEYKGDVVRAIVNGSYAISEYQRVTAGIEYDKYTASDSFSPESSFDDRAVFGSYRYIVPDLLGARTIFEAVVRYDDFDTFDSKGTYRFGIKRDCNIVPGLFSSASIYSSYKAPSIYQYSTNGSLEPEETEGYELSLGYEDIFEATYFHNRIKNRIDYDYATWSYFNSPSDYTLDGVEISAKYAISTTGLVVGGNYTYMIDMDDQNGAPVLRVAKKSGNIFVDYYMDSDIHLGATMRYVGSRRDYGGVELDSYTVVDLTYGQKIGKDLKLSVNLRNLTDEDYETASGYSTEGRSVYARIEYRF